MKKAELDRALRAAGALDREEGASEPRCEGEVMRLEGRISKSGGSKYWLAEVRDLDLLTQGASRKDAIEMLEDAVESLVNWDGFRADVAVNKDGNCTIGSNDDAKLVALMLRRLRARAGLSVRDVAARLGSKSPNA